MIRRALTLTLLALVTAAPASAAWSRHATWVEHSSSVTAPSLENIEEGIEESPRGNGAVTTAKLHAEAVTPAATKATGTPAAGKALCYETSSAFEWCAGGGLGSESVTTANLKAEAVTAAKIAAGAVTLPKVTAGGTKAVGKSLCVKSGETEFEWCAASLGSESVLTTNIAAEAITEAKLAKALLPQEEAVPSGTSGTLTLNAATHTVFLVTVEHATEIKFSNTLPNRPVPVQLKLKHVTGSGTSFAVTIEGLTTCTGWRGNKPNLTLASEAATATVGLTFYATKNTEPIGEQEGVPGGATTGQVLTATSECEAKWESASASTKHTQETKDWALAGAVTNGTYPGFFTAVSTGEKQTFKKLQCKDSKGTITAVVRKGGTEITGMKITGVETTAKESTGTVETTTSGEYIDLKLETEASTPENVACTLVIEKAIKE